MGLVVPNFHHLGLQVPFLRELELAPMHLAWLELGLRGVLSLCLGHSFDMLVEVMRPMNSPMMRPQMNSM